MAIIFIITLIQLQRQVYMKEFHPQTDTHNDTSKLLNIKKNVVLHSLKGCFCLVSMSALSIPSQPPSKAWDPGQNLLQSVKNLYHNC